MRISPEVGWSSPLMSLSSVVLPEPDSPTRPNRSPGWMSRVTSRTACTTGGGVLSDVRGLRNSRLTARRLMAGAAAAAVVSVIRLTDRVETGEARRPLPRRVAGARSPRGKRLADLRREVTAVAEDAAVGELARRRDVAADRVEGLPASPLWNALPVARPLPVTQR